jgi:hypothetical protein
MIITGQGPGINFIIGVRLAIMIIVSQPRNLASLRYIDIAILVSKAKGFMQAMGKPFKERPLKTSDIGVGNEPYFSPSSTNGQAPIGQRRHSTDFEYNVLRYGKRIDPVIILFAKSLNFSCGVFLGERRRKYNQ